ncbi:protoheme IX farnesyltransferase [Skeletonema marinoi]|uniref:Heme O synthase n=2 Tax=cellular organisms TaxID=131567 RepID=A0AAD8YBJ3_9STRA|nr:protoheme IX farnesyltransferase [Skeletonema marinoi]
MTSILYISGRQLRRSICPKQSSTSFQHIICTNTARRRRIIINHSSLFSSSTTSNDDEKNSSRESAASESIDTNDATNNDNNDSTTTTSLPSPPKSNISNLAELSKARLSALVVSTTAFGFMSVGPTALAYTSLPTFAAASIGTALCASSAATFNQVIEIERDSKMKRTGNRPLVNGSVSKQTAIGLGCLTGSTGGILLGLGTDPITTMLGVGNIGLYAGLYTYLKPRSEINTWVGAVVGAIPPVMGWTAAGGSILDPEAVLLGSTLFLWQFPHFFALNWMYRTDYKRGGFSMVAVNDPNGDRTASLIKRYGVYLASLPFLSTALEVTSPMFAVEGILLNGYALHVASKFDKERSNSNARKVFLTSLWYLPCVMMLFLLHSRRWHEEVTNDEKDETILDSFQKLMSKIQAKGKELCMHEALVSKEVEVSIGEGENKTSLDGSKCPISMTKNAQISMGTGKEEVTLPLEEDPTSDER